MTACPRGAIRRLALVALVWLALPPAAAAQPDAIGGCDSTPGFYEAEGFVVREILVQSPFDFVGSFRRALEEAKARLPVRVGEPYRGAAVTQGVSVIEDAALGETFALITPVRLAVTVAQIERCEQTAAGGSLVVRYRVYTSRLPLTWSRTFEAGPKAETNPAEGANVRSRRVIQIEPSLGYTRTDRVTGGVRAAMRDLRGVEAFDADLRGSRRMQMAHVRAAGSRSFDDVGISMLEWSANYRYDDLPLESGARRTHVVGALASASFSDLPVGGLLRAGAAVEAGRATSDVDRALPPETVAASDLYSLKAFAATSWRGPRQALNAAYGLQASATGQGFARGFTKQVADVAYRSRVLPVDHRPIDIDLRVSGGWIVNRGALPVSERFFGGNVVEDFLPGAGWSLRANPLIRSFARSELAEAGTSGVGGERFFAINVSVAPTIWGRPLVPPDLVQDEEFQGKVEGQMTNAERLVAQHYAGRTPAFRTFVAANADALRERLAESLETISDALVALEDEVAEEHQERWEACEASVTDATFTLDEVKAEGSAVVAAFRNLAAPGRLLDQALGCAADPAFTDVAEQTRDASAAIRDAQARMRASLEAIDEEAMDARAKAALRPARRVLDRFFHELTLASVAPLVLFDAVSLGPSGEGIRYAAGAGLRVSLVSTVHVTAAYAMNPDRRPGERRGALLFSLDVSQFLF